MARSGLSLSSMQVDELLKLRDEISSVLSRKSVDLKQQLRRLEDGGWSSSRGRTAQSGRRSLKGVKLRPKYRDPVDPSLVWAGRGAQPRWMQERIKAGARQEDFLIGSAETPSASRARKKAASKRKKAGSKRSKTAAKRRSKMSKKAA